MLNGTNPRDQFETVSLLNALAIISGASTVPKEQEVIQVKSSTTPNANDTNDNVQSKSTTSGGFDVAKITLYAGLCVVVLSFIVVAFVYMRKKSQESARSKTMMPEIEYIKMEYGATTSRDMPRLLHQHNDRKRRNGWEVDRAARSRAKYDREMGKGWDEDRGATRSSKPE
ncbi:hypothetical protein BC830DRAFT_219237 [Chytriomyces sp. MP71]|nr:hypothetical protein BC830DRAFT_219237 [Chytriomyces sp. MP71]